MQKTVYDGCAQSADFKRVFERRTGVRRQIAAVFALTGVASMLIRSAL
jgi:hypothetical protein